MSLKTELHEVQVGGRNKVRIGDTVKVKPSRKGKRDGFLARVTNLYRVGEEVHVEVFGGRTDNRGRQVGVGMRTFTLDRIQRVRQTRDGEKIERRAG